MATCDTLEVDLSPPPPINITLEQYPCIDVQILQPDITIEAVTVANQGPKGDTGAQGPPGQSITGPAGPPGNQGQAGNAATIAVGSTTTLTPGTPATVTNSGSSSAATFNFGIPAGVQGNTGATGSTGPQGPTGTAATIAVGSTTTGAPGTNASVTNTGTSSTAVFAFTIPRGDVGATGSQGLIGNTGPTGTAATIAVGTTTTGAAGSNASVTNTGTSSAAVFNFTVPQGIQGVQGPQGPSGAGTGDMLRSTYDTNANNVVDTCDSLAWGKLTGVPSAFTPNAHASTHLAAGSDPIAIATSVLAGLCPAVDNTTIQVVASKLSCVALAWTAITGKPATFIPAAHASTHVTGGGDVIPAPTTSASGAVPVLPATAGATKFLDGTGVFNQVAYANVTGTPTVPAPSSTSPIMDGTATIGVGTTYARNDHVHPTDTSRMAVGAAPTAHATTHKSGGSDVIALDTLDVPTDITTLNVSTTAHGLMPKATGAATTFYGSDNTQKAVPYSSLSGTPTTFAPSAHAASHVTGGSDVIAPASASTAGLLKQLSGNTTDFIDGTNTCQNLVTAIQPTIWSVRLRSWNSVHNPTFSVDQKNGGATVAVPNGGNSYIDRWNMFSSGSTMRISTGQQPGNINVPGTNFAITGTFFRITLTAAQASLAAGDLMQLGQSLEGIQLRELINDVHSCQILVRCSSPLKFGASFRDGSTTRSLTKLCTISTANTWTLIPLPNLPIWSSGATWPVNPGQLGYYLNVTLASGSTNTSPANDVWQNGSFPAAAGQDSFAALAVNSTFDIAYISHEPGAQASNPPMDCPFTQNYDACLRYYCKSYDYATKAGTVTTNGAPAIVTVAGQSPTLPIAFKKPMAKVPTINGFSPSTGAVGNVRDWTSGTDRAISSVNSAGETGFVGFNLTTPNAASAITQFHYTADTGW